MEIFINNKSYFTEDNKLLPLLESLHLFRPKGIAIAVNDTIVSKSEWSAFSIKENDKVMIIQATQGG